MATPILNKRQQNKTLSAKKVTKHVAKTALASPYVRYWPALTAEDNDVITDVILNNLPRIKCDKVNIPWKELKNVPRLEWKEFRTSYQKDFVPFNKTLKKGIVFGINEVTKLLEKNVAVAVLIADDVTPQLMIKHVVELAVLKSQPVLVMSSLREILKNKTGIPAAAVGFRRNLSTDSPYYHVNQKIEEVFVNYPLPANHIHHDRLQKLKDNKIDVDNLSMVKKNDNSNLMNAVEYRCLNIKRVNNNTSRTKRKIEMLKKT